MSKHIVTRHQIRHLSDAKLQDFLSWKEARHSFDALYEYASAEEINREERGGVNEQFARELGLTVNQFDDWP